MILLRLVFQFLRQDAVRHRRSFLVWNKKMKQQRNKIVSLKERMRGLLYFIVINFFWCLLSCQFNFVYLEMYFCLPSLFFQLRLKKVRIWLWKDLPPVVCKITINPQKRRQIVSLCNWLGVKRNCCNSHFSNEIKQSIDSELIIHSEPLFLKSVSFANSLICMLFF